MDTGIFRVEHGAGVPSGVFFSSHVCRVDDVVLFSTFIFLGLSSRTSFCREGEREIRYRHPAREPIWCVACLLLIRISTRKPSRHGLEGGA